MERIYINRECCIAYTVLALHRIFCSPKKEKTLKDVISEIRVMFELYTDENELIEQAEGILKKEGKNKVIIDRACEKIGMTIEECATYLGVSKQLVAELVKLDDFPCIKFKRRILINKLGLNEWMNNNIGKFLDY